MEGNIYNKMSHEINFKIPDINFDSESDDLDDDKPIKPYIRPAAEILFGWEDHECEEILDILSKMPSESKKEDNQEVIPDDSIILNGDCYSNLTEKLPFMNISLPNGIKTHIPLSSNESAGRIILPTLGVRDNLDLDKVLDEMDLSNYESTFFEEAQICIEDDNGTDSNSMESTSELLTRLDEMSKKYEQDRHHLNNGSVDSTRKSRISLSNLFHQLQFESPSETVVLDLRVENYLWSRSLDQEKTKQFMNHINEIVKEEVSSDEESDVDGDVSNELWIDSYRKSKAPLVASKRDDSPVNIQPTKTVVNHISVQDSSDKFENVEILKDQQTFKGAPEIEEEKSIPKDILIKIEKIKQREAVLSERRTISQRLSRLLHVTEKCPLLVHEEISFDPIMFTLLPELSAGKDDEQLFTAIVLLSEPTVAMTVSKVPSPISDSHHNENFAAIVSALIQLSHHATTNSPFTVLGLQQIFHKDELQLSLLCKTGSSITKLKMELKKLTLRDILTSRICDRSLISGLPLSNILQILPYNPVVDGNIWSWNNSSITWRKIEQDGGVFDNHNGCRPLNINTSCLLLEEDFYLCEDFYELLLTILERYTFSAIKLIYHSDGRKQLVLAVRGYDAIDVIKAIQNKSSLYRKNVTCTRFPENSLKELVKYFGPRLNNDKIAAMLQDNRDRDVASDLSEGLSIYHGLYFNEASDAVLLVSPMCLDVGWIINTLLTIGGYLLVNMTRLHLPISAGRQLGINEQLVDHFESQNGVCHLLVLRNENPMHGIKSVLKECAAIIYGNDESMHTLDQIFYPIPYSDSLLDLLDLQNMCQTPYVRELAHDIPESPSEDCEQCSFVLLISDELSRHLSQVLDQMSNLDLLAVKCMTTWPSDDHLELIQSQFKIRLPKFDVDRMFEESEGKMRIAVIAIRSMFLMKELEKIQSTIRVEKNLIFAYTMNVSVTFGMVGSFFTSSELISDSRRRSSLKFLPVDIVRKLANVSILSQFPLIYTPIETALSVPINSNNVLNKFRQLWFLLTREGFIVTNVLLDEMGVMRFVVQRPNAIFYLTQWIKSHFRIEDKVTMTQSEEEINGFSFKNFINAERPIIKSLSFSKGPGNIAFLMLNESLLNSSPDVLAISKVLWTFLEENDYNCISLSLRNITGSDIFKLKDVCLRNLSGSQMRKETSYLSFIVTGNSVAIVLEDLLKCKIGSLKSDSRLLEDLYICCDNVQIIECSNIILGGVILNHPSVEIDYKLKC